MESFRAAVDWYPSSGIGDILRNAITKDFAGATRFSNSDRGKLVKIIKDARARM